MRLVVARVVAFLRQREIALAAVLMALSIGVLLSGAVEPTFTCLNGDMRSRYDAQVPPELADLYLDAERMDVGFGAAALGGWEGLGDALALGGRVFVRHTNRASPRYYHLASNRYFQSNAFVYVPARRAPSERIRLDADTRVDQLLDRLARDYPQGVIATGALRFAPFKTIAMSAPAIAGDPVAQRAVRYYTRPMEIAEESWAYVVLIAARDESGRLAGLVPPASIRTVPAGQALALRLRTAPLTQDGPALADNAVSVGQLLKDAMVMEGELALYPIASVLPCGEPRAATASIQTWQGSDKNETALGSASLISK